MGLTTQDNHDPFDQDVSAWYPEKYIGSGAQQARCKCGAPLSGDAKHADGCTYWADLAALMRPATAEDMARWNAGAQNAYAPALDEYSEPPNVIYAKVRWIERIMKLWRK